MFKIKVKNKKGDFFMTKKFNCTNCGFCCGPVPITEREFARIKKFVKKLPLADICRLKGQKRDSLSCIFRDEENGKCTIYPVRQDICKMFGFYEGMVCPNNPEHATRSRKSGYSRIEKNKKGSKVKGLMSIDVTLKTFLA